MAIESVVSSAAKDAQLLKMFVNEANRRGMIIANYELEPQGSTTADSLTFDSLNPYELAVPFAPKKLDLSSLSTGEMKRSGSTKTL